MKPGIEQEKFEWSLSWHPDGRCDSFTKESILLYAPRTSGVYGLFNRDCQVLIGESENICEALLHHESETDFRSQHLHPTGFTFEPCAADLRKSRAADLIARFHPVLQADVALAEFSSRSNSPGNEKASHTDAAPTAEPKAYPDQEFPAHEHGGRPKNRRHFEFHRLRIAILFVACAAVAIYLAMPANYTFHQRANGANTILDSKLASVSKSPDVKSAVIASPESGGRVVASVAGSNVIDASKSIPAPIRSDVQAKADPPVRPTQNPKSNKNWSVQVSATPSKEIADKLVQQLKSEGYAVYVVQAEVKGQIYHRVRIGPFSAREEAEPVRQSLTRHEAYRDAYLASE